jgi:serine/threonine protein kinase
VKLCDFGSAHVHYKDQAPTAATAESAAAAAAATAVMATPPSAAAAAAATPTESAAAAAAAAAANLPSVAAASTERPYKRQRGRDMKAVAGSPLYALPEIGSKTVDNSYGDECDSYSIIVLTMSLLLGGYDALFAVAEKLPAGCHLQQHSLYGWLAKVSKGLEPQQLQLSRELRDFVHAGINMRCTPKELLSHPWIVGAQI